MRNIVKTYVERFRREKQTRRRLAGIVGALALVVVFGVFWQLHYTGVAMVNETFCGEEEHQHDESCYEKQLVCDEEESAETEGHTHSEDCYDEDGDLICGLEESEDTKGHTHDDSCYEDVLVCDLEEHTHTTACLVDETADVETAADWEATLPELSGVRADDVAAVAESQVGYTESESNFQLAEDGQTRQGYTRYGAWYGNEYGDWDAMFASFCLNYAGVPTEDFPEAAGAYAWMAELQRTELYEEAADLTPSAGDLVFLDSDADGQADQVAVVTSVADEGLTYVQGNSNDAVEETTIEQYSKSIVGYGVLSQPSVSADDVDDVLEENDALEEETEDAAETDSHDIQTLMDGTDSTFPVNTIYSLSVIWTTSGTSETVYSWTRDNHVTSDNNSDQSTIDALASGSYRVRIDFEDLRSDQDLLVGGSYVLALDWPTGEGVTVETGAVSGTITSGSTDIATWILNPETGEITITILNRTDDDNFWIEFTATVTKGDEPEPDGDDWIATGSINKDGEIDELVDDKITYTITAVVPRYTESANGGKAYVWSIDDVMSDDAAYGGTYNNDMSDVEIVMTSTQYPGGIIVPSVENATDEDEYAYYVKVDSDKEDEIIFLNRCTCDEADCANWSAGCGNLYDDTGFCSCWLSIYNATFTITYSVDISDIIQRMEDANTNGNTAIMNTARLYNGGAYPVDQNSDQEYVYRPFTKTELINPDRNTENKGVGSYKIEISEHDVDYSWADDIEITDVMDNLALVEDSLTVTVGDTVLTLIVEEEAANLDPDTDRGKYFSYTYTDVTDDSGEKTGGTLVIKIWYPTNQDITIEYQASVISYNTSPTGDYSNSVTIGETGYTLNGSYQEGSSGEGGSGLTCSMTLTKVDAEENAVVLPGAVFEIYRHVEDDDDILVDTLTTGEDGTFTFASNDDKGYWMDRDVLYYVKETQAPDGYVPDSTMYGFVFLRNGYDGTYPDGLDPQNVILGEPDGDQIHIEITVENSMVTAPLPNTGGSGTWPYTAAGLLLVFGGGGWLVYRKRGVKIV